MVTWIRLLIYPDTKANNSHDKADDTLLVSIGIFVS